jgi:hypothetical protein
MAGDPFTAAKLALLDKAVGDRAGGLTHLDFRVLYYLYSAMDRRTGVARRKHDVIADAVGAKRRGVQQSIDRMRVRGYLAVATSRGAFNANAYSIPENALAEGANKCAPPCAFSESEMRTERQQNAHSWATKCAPPCAQDSLSLSLEESPERERRTPAKTIPENWKLSDSDHDFAVGEGVLNIDEMLAAFVDYYRGEGTAKANWSAVWRRWVRRERQFNPTKLTSHAAEKILARLQQAPDPEPFLTDEAWSGILSLFVKTGVWTRNVDICGNAPPSPDCRAPKHILAKFGLAEAAA